MRNALQKANTTFDGNPVLYNIFSAYPDIPNYMTFLLSRSDIGVTEGGVFTIGDVNASYSDILNQTQLHVLSNSGAQWVVDVDGIVVNGERFGGNSSVHIQHY